MIPDLILNAAAKLHYALQSRLVRMRVKAKREYSGKRFAYRVHSVEEKWGML